MINDLTYLPEEQEHLVLSAVKKCKRFVDEENMSVSDAVKKVCSIYESFFDEISFLENILFTEVTQVGNSGKVIASKNIRDKDWWDNYKKGAKLSYWRRYKNYLELKPGWSDTSITDLDSSIDKVMNLLVNPNKKQIDDRIGLVYGDVQAGKTAHYMGLINKAYSAGYKIIIVLTGMHNSLRSQTQTRIDEEVLGYETSNNSFDMQKQNSVGVGLVKSNLEVGGLQSLTNRDENGDISSRASGSFFPPYIIVTKKNAKVLGTIIDNFSKSPFAIPYEDKKVISPEYPALIIDDEADQASINTKDPINSEDPSAINGLIRKLLNIFQCRSYVGYTATPFANIFIPKETKDKEFGEDLFPRDFIVKAPRPSLYVGAKEFFGFGDEYIAYNHMPLLRVISSEEGMSYGHKNKDGGLFYDELPKELLESIMAFYIVVAVRNQRGQINKPNTMLIHVVRFVEQQKIIQNQIKEHLEFLNSQIINNDRQIKREFKNLYETDFKDTNQKMHSDHEAYSKGCTFIEFDNVWSEIKNIIAKPEHRIKIFCINGKSDDALVYKKYEGKPFNVIAIGGDKLSRGLTLEGLSISYFSRVSSTMDTLMQMGRWFGYRNGYIDVCRIYSTEKLFEKFRHISYSVANLSQQFEDMDVLQSDPENFGLKVATNPDILISARNKLRTGKEYRSDFSCKLVQTRILDTNPEIIENNYKAVEKLLVSIKNYKLCYDQSNKNLPIGLKDKNGKHFYGGVSSSYIIDFFENYHTSKHSTRASSRHIAEYIKEMNKYGGLIEWTVCLNGLVVKDKNNEYVSKIANITVQGIERNTNKNLSNCDKDYCDLGAIVSGDDAELDFDKTKLELAVKRRNELENEKDKQILARIVRKELRDFSHGYLILYPIGWAQSNLKTNNGIAPYGFATVFPDRLGKGQLQSYRLNEVAMEELDDEG